MRTLYEKTLTATGERMFLMYPGEENRTPFKRRSLTILLDRCTREHVTEVIEQLGLETLSLEKEFVMCFPVPDGDTWAEMPFAQLYKRFTVCQEAMTKPDDLPLPRNSFGIPTLEAMMSTWHPMNDTKYLMGLGTGADAAVSLATCKPANIAALLAVGGGLPVTNGLSDSAVPVCLLYCAPEVEAYFKHANGMDTVRTEDGMTVFAAAHNPLQQTFIAAHGTVLDAGLMRWVWEHVFMPVRRTNTCIHGDVEPSMDIEQVGFEYFIEDMRLGDGKPHTWFTHVPQMARQGTKVPLVIFCHGGSDNPAEAAEMTKLHELGEREGFITVYPWGTNRCGWNSAMEEDQEDDIGFCDRLIDYHLRSYPVDPERVYVTGFSNGAAMAQTIALIHPEKVAALFHIDSNWPGAYGGYLSVTEEDVTPFRLGFARQKEYDYRMPVWYTYGSRERSFPIFRASTQQNQYDLWKRYNHIAVSPTPEQGEDNPTGCGVRGETFELCYPSQRHPGHYYQIHRFYTDDEAHLNLYNMALMHNKGHEVAQMDAELGWQYVRQFRRYADGSLGIVPNE